MKMLTKFELKSLRAKGVAFHPTRPWLAVALHLLTIQLWDYRMGVVIDRLEEHEGPVRLVDFHPTQPILVSGGDDNNIKVWLLLTRKCLFTLAGHLDYVRHVSFHKVLPWIISCSDDQTIRIWNWQNRKEIACLTGHNHYVMLAKFHPTEDLIVLASLDQTVRVWDIAGLRKKHSAPGGGMGSVPPQFGSARLFEDQLARNPAQQDAFGNTDAVVKYVLEGHDRGVNWADFHPKMPLIVSGGDDRLVKLWRMSETKAWEVDTCRGHTANVLCTLFHPTQDLILLVSDDKTLRIWDLNKRTPVKQFKRDNDRFWLATAHPSMNLFAACHDLGVMVFKLERERPAYAWNQNRMFFINGEKQVQFYDYELELLLLPMLLLKKIGKPWLFIRTLLYNPAERLILVTVAEGGENGTYALIQLPKDVTGAIEPTDIRQGEGLMATFIARNRFVTYTKTTDTLEVRDLNNNVTKLVKFELPVKDVVAASPGTVLLLKSGLVVHYDVQQKRELAECAVAGVKYVAWLPDSQYAALLAKHTITIVNKRLEVVSTIRETIRVKSAAWDDTNVLLYLTLNHIKYSLLNGDNGIIKTSDQTVYLVRAHGTSAHVLTRQGTVEQLVIDPTEYRFKRALVNKQFGEVMRIIKHSNLVGQNIIAYLSKTGYPEVALQFVEDPETRFDLALACGDLDVALAEARKLNSKLSWERLGKEALSQGNFATYELVLQQLKLFDKLLFVYLAQGDASKLAKMQQIAEVRGETSSLVQTTFYTNDVQKRIEVLAAAGMHPLAYASAKTAGLDALAAEILTAAGLTERDVVLPAGVCATPIEVPEAVEKSTENWPLKPTQASFIEQAVAGDLDNLTLESTREAFVGGADGEAEAFVDDEELAEEGGWDMGDDDLEIEEAAADAEADEELKQALGLVSGETAHWLRNSRTAAGHVAAGLFETAAQLLKRQIGATQFEPLRARFMEVYQANKAYLPGAFGAPLLPVYVRSDYDEEDVNKVLPYVPGYEQLEERLHDGFAKFRANKLEEAIAVFRSIIHTVCVCVVPLLDEEEVVKDILTHCREYILGLLIELERRRVEQTDVKRNLELAAYFTRARLQPAHRANALQVAMTQAFKHKNFALAAYFADEFLAIVESGPRREQANKIKARASQLPFDAVEIDFSPGAECTICPATFTPIYNETPFVREALTGAKYLKDAQGTVDVISGVTQVGAPASGLKIVEG